MNSIWLCCDAEPAKPLLDAKAGKESQPSQIAHSHMGVFTDSPARIGAALPRPVTPVPGVVPGIVTKEIETMEVAETQICDSPPSDLSLDFEKGRFFQTPFSLVIF